MPDARLLIAPNSPHTVMVSQPALFNQAAASFYRSTEEVARQRAETHGRRAAIPAATAQQSTSRRAVAVAEAADDERPFQQVVGRR